MLLGCRAPLQRDSRCHRRRFRLHRRLARQPYLRAGLFRQDWPCGSRGGDLRPEQGHVRRAPQRVLEHARPDDTQLPGPGPRPPVPLGDLLPQPRAGGGGPPVGRPGAAVLQEADRDRDRPRHPLLESGGISPALLRQAPGPLLLPLHPWLGARGAGRSHYLTIAQRRRRRLSLPTVRCDHCAQEVPDGVFCTRCGAHQGTTKESGDAKSREHRYAAHPGEHVAHPAIFTTLFPHLGHHKIHEFRWAFIAGLAGVLVLYLAGLITAAILVSAFLVPVLYLIYLYEAQVYRDEPALVLGFTIGGGVVVGIVVTLFERLIYNPFQYAPNPLSGAGLSIGALLILGLVMPLIQEALKPIPAFFLPNRADFPETVDGLVFGVAAGLGFSVAETLIGFSSTLTSLPAQSTPGNWIYDLATLAIFQPLLQGSATGMIVATIWRFRRGRLAGREIGAVAMAVIAHIAFSTGTVLMKDASVNPLFILIWQAVVGSLLIYIRYLLHYSLLEEAAHMGFAETVCPNCHMHIVASGFCPNCGMALSAVPGAVRRSRKPRAEPVAPASKAKAK